MPWTRTPLVQVVLTGFLLLTTVTAVRGEAVIFREIVGETDVAKLLSWGLRYREGNGVARNIDRAIKLYCKAARNGHPEAQFQLGMIYAKGENLRHVRHGEILERWPVLAEPWARRIEEARLAAVDRTPGAATFGR